jgi:organic radical activating enzyme
MTLDELLAEIASYKAKTVVLTGGEPTLIEGAPELIAALKAAGYFIAVETNATVDAPWLQFVDYVACSPKAEFPDKIELKKANEVRVVASDDRAVEFCRRVKEIIEADDYYVSPCDHDGEIDFATAKSVLSKLDGWSLSVQLHKILGFR